MEEYCLSIWKKQINSLFNSIKKNKALQNTKGILEIVEVYMSETNFDKTTTYQGRSWGLEK